MVRVCKGASVLVHVFLCVCVIVNMCLCHGAGAVQQYLTRVMALGYTDTPDYPALKAGLHDALLVLGGALERPLSAMTSCH